MNELTTIIFSKNRAAQLELLLRGMNIPVNVIYTFDKDFREGYVKLIRLYPHVIFIKQEDLRSQVLRLISSNSYAMFLADDDVFIRPFFAEDSAEFKEFKSSKDIVTLSLSLCPQYRYRNLPVLSGNKWEWLPYSEKKQGYRLRIWGYPMGMIGHIFRLEDIYTVIEKNEIRIPNDIEGVLTKNIPKRPLMMCLDKPRVINNQANQVQNIFPDKNFGISLAELEQNFLKGKRLSLDDIKEKAEKARSYHLMTNYEYEHQHNT